MGYVNSDLYFFMDNKIVSDLANEAMAQSGKEVRHPLEEAANARSAENAGELEAQADASWEHLPAEQSSTATATVNVYVYLDNFIYVIQWDIKERRHMIRHLFLQTDKVFRPNGDAYINLKEPVSYPTSTHISCRASLGVCPPFRPCAGGR